MTKFIRNQQVPFEEGLRCEFKSLTQSSNPVPQIREFVDVYVVAYLNRDIAGSIYWGITDRGKAVGLPLDREARDDVRKAIDGKLRSITPFIFTSAYEIDFLDLFEADGDTVPMPDRSIVKVDVNRVSPRQVYFTSNHKAYYKTHSGREELAGNRLTELQKEISNEQADPEKQEGTPTSTAKAPTVKASKAPVVSASFENPYDSAVVATEDMFKGRETEIDQLQYSIRNGTHTAIFGLQRMGKTSLVEETLRRIKNENCIFAQVDLQRYGGEHITYKALLHAIVTRIAREISPARHRVVVNQIDELASIYGGGDKHQMLDDFSEILEKIVKVTRRKIILFLDEFSELCQTIDKNEELLNRNPDRRLNLHPHEMLVDVSLMHWFSSLMKSNEIKGKFVFIFAVRPFVAEYDADTHLSILKLVSPIMLHHLSQPAAEALMVEPVKDQIKYGKESINYLYNLTAGHPYLIQFFLQEIINRIQPKGRLCIEKEDIVRFEEEVVSVEKAYDGQFAVLDSDYSVESVKNSNAARKGKGVLAVIAHLGGDQKADGWVPVEQVKEELTRYGMPENEIYDILAKLRRARIIEERKADREKLEYRISIPLLRKRYARQNMYQRHFLRRNFRS